MSNSNLPKVNLRDSFAAACDLTEDARRSEMKATSGNQVAAAKLLGISRSTLRAKLAP